ncbi:MAG: hypothetical protein ACP5O1_03805 [Phycisphaerae bacterium]
MDPHSSRDRQSLPDSGLIATAVFAALANLVAALLALADIRWSVKPALSPWSGLLWPYAVLASSAAIWLAIICQPTAPLTRYRQLATLTLSAASALAGALPMLIIAACISAPAHPWQPLLAMLGVACVIISAQSLAPPRGSRLQWAVRCCLLFWIFVLPAVGILQVGITIRNMPFWAIGSPLYWLHLLLIH